MALTTTIRKAEDNDFDADTITATLANGTELRVYVYESTPTHRPMVQIDTDIEGRVGRFSIAVNDGYVWDADPELPLRVDDRNGRVLVNVEPDPLPATDAVDAIAALMSGSEWSADTVEAIAAIVRRSGRTVADVDA